MSKKALVASSTSRKGVLQVQDVFGCMARHMICRNDFGWRLES